MQPTTTPFLNGPQKVSSAQSHPLKLSLCLF